MDKGEKILQIVENSACLKSDQLIGYLDGTLFREELRVVELHLASCSLCQEAIEGMENLANRKTIIASLELPELPSRKPVVERPTESSSPTRRTFSHTAKKPTAVPPPVIPKSTFNPNPNKFLNRSRNLSWLGVVGIAALLLLGGFLFWQYESNTPNWPSFTFYNNKGTSEDILIDSNQTEPEDTTQDKTTEQQLLAANKQKKTLKPELPSDTQVVNVAPTTEKKGQKDSLKTNSLIAAARLLKPDTPPSQLKPAQNDAASENATSESAKKDKTVAAVTQKPANKDKAVAKEESAPSKKANQTTTSKETEPLNNSDYGTGLQLYQKKQYASALLYLRTAAENNQDPNHWQAVYYSGLCNLEIGKKGRGRRLLKRVAKAGVSLSAKAEQQLEKLESSGNE